MSVFLILLFFALAMEDLAKDVKKATRRKRRSGSV